MYPDSSPRLARNVNHMDASQGNPKQSLPPEPQFLGDRVQSKGQHHVQFQQEPTYGSMHR